MSRPSVADDRMLVADRRFRHPGYELFLSTLREEVAVAGALNEDDGLVLLRGGLNALAIRHGCSIRTIRRRLRVAGLVVREFVSGLRLRVTRSPLIAQVPLALLAKWLGYRNVDALRRFNRRESGVSVVELRRRVRQCTVFLR